MEILLHHTTADQVLLNDAFQFVRCQLLVINTFRYTNATGPLWQTRRQSTFAPVYPILGYGIAQFRQSLFQEVPAVRAHIRYHGTSAWLVAQKKIWRLTSLSILSSRRNYPAIGRRYLYP